MNTLISLPKPKWWMTMAASLILLSSTAFAKLKDCKNSFELTLKDSVKMKFCEIPAADNVAIGSKDGQSNELPVIGRNFKKFHMGQYEVTQLQYKKIMQQEPWKKDGKLRRYVQEGDNNPAVYVKQSEARQFASALNLIDKEATYRLSTEAEWEYAARGLENQDGPHYWGDDFDGNFAYYWGNSRGVAEHARNVKSCPQPDRHPGYCANDYGLMHMLGNVWEWTADVYKDTYENVPTNGHKAVEGTGADRVIRGGSWYGNAGYVRSTHRLHWRPGDHYHHVGLRLVRMAK